MALVNLSSAISRHISSPNSVLQNYLTIEEDPNDTAMITRHPVELGAIMSDHIFHMPPELRLRLGWSNADPQSTGANYVQDIYAQILAIKNARQLCTVFTGKRIYNNMAVGEVRGPTTDYKTENAIIVTIVFQQLMLVNLTNSSGQPTSTTASPNPSANNQANPPAGLPTSGVGQVQPQPTNIDPAAIGALNTAVNDANAAPVVVGNPNSTGGGVVVIPSL